MLKKSAWVFCGWIWWISASFLFPFNIDTFSFPPSPVPLPPNKTSANFLRRGTPTCAVRCGISSPGPAGLRARCPGPRLPAPPRRHRPARTCWSAVPWNLWHERAFPLFVCLTSLPSLPTGRKPGALINSLPPSPVVNRRPSPVPLFRKK